MLEKCGDEAANAEVEYKTMFSQERLKAKARGIEEGGRRMTDAQADDHATENTKDQHLGYKIAANKFTTQRELVKALEVRCSALQTVARAGAPL